LDSENDKVEINGPISGTPRVDRFLAYKERIREIVDCSQNMGVFGDFVSKMCLMNQRITAAMFFVRHSSDKLSRVGGAGNGFPGLKEKVISVGDSNAIAKAMRQQHIIAIGANDGEGVLGEDLIEALGGVPIIVAPVVTSDTANGVLIVVGDARKDDFGEDDIELFEEISEELCPALEIIMLREQLASEAQRADFEVEKRTRELSALNDLTRDISYTDDAKTLFNSVFQSFDKVLNFDAGAAIIFAGRMRKVYLKVQAGSHKAVLQLASAAFDVVESLGSRRLRKKSFDLVLLENLKEGAPEFLPEIKMRLAAPVIFAGKLHGAIIMFRHDSLPFTEDASRYLFAVTNQVSLAVRRMLVARKTQRTRLRTMLRSMAEGLLMVDKYYRFDIMNPAGEQLLAMCTTSKKRSRLRKIGPMEAVDLIGPILSGEKSTTRCEIAAITDRTRRISISVSAVRGYGKRVNGAVVILRDVTQERMLQEQLSQAEKLSSIGEMISGVAHELNNPLTSVIGFSELLIERPDMDAGVRSDLKKIYSEAERARKIIQNLLTFARKRISRRKPVDLNYIIDQAIEFRSYDLTSNNIKVEKIFQVPFPKALADRYQLQQVFLNFIVNAQQAMKSMGGGTLTLSTKSVGDYVRATVKDTGPGIPKESLGRIFDPFFTTKPVGEGTGLGLSIAYGIISDLGGKLKVDSEPGKGTSIVVELPVYEVAEVETDDSVMAVSADGTSDDSKTRMEAIESPTEKKELPPLKVLVADDEPFILELVNDVLVDIGFTVQKAANGQEALDWTNKEDYDLIICDLKMPRLSGQDFFKQIKQNKPQLISRLMFMTGDVVSPGTRSFLKKSKAYVLEKPFRASTLLKRVNMIRERLAELDSATS